MKGKCLSCGAPLMEKPLLVCENMPAVAQHMPSKEEIGEDRKLTLNLCQCSGCGLVQFDAEPVWYYRNVIRSGGYSTTMVNLRREQYERFLSLCPVKNGRIVEVGCGQGEFLRVWRQFGFPVKVYGIENDPELVKKARDDELEVIQGFVEDESEIENGPFDAFCSFNFLEHQPAPLKMLRAIHHNLKETAYGLITVPSWEYILEHQGFYELIHDHLAYYSEETFRFVLENSGFRVLEMRRINRDTHEAIVEKRKREDVEGLKKNRSEMERELRKFVDECNVDGRIIAIWGASHQGFTLLSNIGIGDKISYVIDSAPFKQGKYTSGEHTPIVSPEYFRKHPVDSVLIVAPGYSDEICRLIKEMSEKKILIATLRAEKVEILQEGWRRE